MTFTPVLNYIYTSVNDIFSNFKGYYTCVKRQLLFRQKTITPVLNDIY